MDYSREPGFKNQAWKEKKAENKVKRHGRGKTKDKDDSDVLRKGERYERCRNILMQFSI
jgi:hypothetical protein